MRKWDGGVWAVMLTLLIAAGCKRESPSAPGTAAASAPATRAVAVGPASLDVGGTVVVFAPAQVMATGDGSMRLAAESEAATGAGNTLAGAGNTFAFQMTPVPETEPTGPGAAPDVAADTPAGADTQAEATTRWTWVYALTNADEQPSGGIRSVSDPENGLRPIALQVELERTGGVVTVTLAGKFVSLSAENPLSAPTVDVRGNFQARWIEK